MKPSNVLDTVLGARRLVACSLLASAALLAGCTDATASPPPEAPPDHEGVLLVRGATLPGGGAVDLMVRDGRVESVQPAAAEPPAKAVGLEIVEAAGRWLVPAFIDSHVHLQYLPRHEEMADGGVAAAVDMAAPISSLKKPTGPLLLRQSGPMVTAVGGYPTQGWGAGGYGTTVGDAAGARATVQALSEAGVNLIKLPFTGPPQLSEEAFRAAVDEAHERGLPVAAHALGAADARLAGEVGADVLAHTPVATLDPVAVTAWAGRTVVSTLRAFGGGDSAVQNLRALDKAGVTVLYGTDFGNTSTAGIDAVELTLLLEAGLSPAEIIEAGTTAPAAFWGFDDLGSLTPGFRASFLLVDGDPLVDVTRLAAPAGVWIDGVKRD